MDDPVRHMAKNTALIDYLKTRRSVGIGFLAEPGPSPEELEAILTIGMRVPDHGKFAPWRLVIISGEDRAKAGELLAERAKKAGVEQCVFDRSGYRYHGRIKALADGAREGGLEF